MNSAVWLEFSSMIALFIEVALLPWQNIKATNVIYAHDAPCLGLIRFNDAQSCKLSVLKVKILIEKAVEVTILLFMYIFNVYVKVLSEIQPSEKLASIPHYVPLIFLSRSSLVANQFGYIPKL